MLHDSCCTFVLLLYVPGEKERNMSKQFRKTVRFLKQSVGILGVQTPVGFFSTQFLRKLLIFPQKWCFQGFQARGAPLGRNKLVEALLTWFCAILHILTLFDAMSFWKSLQGFGHLRNFLRFTVFGRVVVQNGSAPFIFLHIFFLCLLGSPLHKTHPKLELLILDA